LRFTTTEGLLLLEIGPPTAQATGPPGGVPAAPTRPELGTILGQVRGAGGTSGFLAIVRLVKVNRDFATGLDGAFRFAEVPPGTYTVRAEASIGGRTLSGEQRIVVPPGGTARVTVLAQSLLH
jgi:hypothetical protein